MYFFWASFDKANFKNSVAAFFLSSSIYLLIAKLLGYTMEPLTPSVRPGKADAMYTGI